MSRKPIAFIFLLALALFIIPFSTAWVDNSAAAQNVNGCGVLATSNAVYTLIANIESTGNETCFSIWGATNNVVFNMAGFNITTNNTLSETGAVGFYSVNNQNLTINGAGGTIKQWGLNQSGAGMILNSINATINNVNIFNNSIGIQMSSSNGYNKFYNLTVTKSVNIGLNILGGTSNNKFYDTKINDNLADGMYLGDSVNPNGGNYFYRTQALRNGNDAIVLDLSNSNYFENTIVNVSGRYGVTLHDSDNNTLNITTSNNNTNTGLYVLTSDDNFFYTTVANKNVNEGIYANTASGNVFYDTTTNLNAGTGIVLLASESFMINVNSNNNTVVGIYFDTTDNSLIINGTIIGNNQGIVFTTSTGNYIYNLNSWLNTVKEVGSANWGTSTDNRLIYADNTQMAFENGQIVFTPLVADVVGELKYGSGEMVFISLNNAYFNESKITSVGGNFSATIYLHGLPTTMFQPQIYKDDAVCSSPQCVAGTSLNAGDVDFDVSGWSSYSVRGGTAPACSGGASVMASLIVLFMALAILSIGIFAVMKFKDGSIELNVLIYTFIGIIIGLALLPVVADLVASC